MKARLTTSFQIFCLVLVQQIVTAQSFSLDVETEGVYLSTVDEIGYAKATVTNISGDALELDIVRQENLDDSSWLNGMCIGDVCYPILIDSVRVLLLSGESVVVRSGFQMGTLGASDKIEMQYLLKTDFQPDGRLMFNSYAVNNSSVSTSSQELVSVDVQAYPNPTTDLLTVKAEGLQSVELYDVTGSLLQTYSAEVISLADQPTGRYLLKVTTVDGATGTTVVIKR